jgi:hypothetical protein
MNKITILGLGFLLCGQSLSVQAQEDVDPAVGPCRLELVSIPSVDWLGPFGRGYEVFVDNDAYEAFSVEIKHTGSACKYVLTGSDSINPVGGTLNSGISTLKYDILTSSNGPSLLSPEFAGNQTSRIEGEFAAGNGVTTLPLLVSIPANQIVRNGTYQGHALLKLFSIDNGAEHLQSDAALHIRTQVNSIMEIRSPDFGAGIRSTSIDLGDLSRGAERDLEFSVRSNADVNVSFKSHNNGILAHSYGAKGIPYQLRVRGVSVDLTSGSAILLPFRDGAAESDVPINILVPEAINGRVAGNYNDTLLVTFTVP